MPPPINENMAEALSMSGFEFMQAVLKGDASPPPIAGVMGFTLDSVGPGEVAFRGAPTVDFTNPMGTTHGGWYGAILDSAMGCAVMTTVPKGSVYTTLEYKINLTRGIPLGIDVIATATVDHAGRTTAVVSAELRGTADNKLYATGSSTCIIMKMAASD